MTRSFRLLPATFILFPSVLSAQPPEPPQAADVLTAKLGTPEHKAVETIFDAWNSTQNPFGVREEGCLSRRASRMLETKRDSMADHEITPFHPALTTSPRRASLSSSHRMMGTLIASIAE